MKRAIVATVLVVILGAGGFFGYRSFRGKEARYRELSLKRGRLEVTILATGVVKPQNQVDIKAPINGRVERVLLREGARVKRGQVIAWMSSTERAALLDAARSKGTEEVAKWEKLYKPTPILAPIDGTIIERNVETGQSFTSADAIFVMSDRLTVKAQVDETDIAQVKVKQLATVLLDAYPDHKLPASVDEIAYNAKTVNNVTTYEVDVTPKEKPPFMRSGMTANVHFLVASKENVLLLATEAIQSGREGTRVLVKSAGGRPEERAIEIGLTDGKSTEVVDGLEERDVVLVAERRGGGKGAAGRNPFAPGGGGGRPR